MPNEEQRQRRTASKIAALKTATLQKLLAGRATTVGASGNFPELLSSKLLICLLAAVLCLLASGCSMVSGKRRADGTLVVTSWRLLWKSEAIEFSAGDTNFSATLRVGKSRSDEESIKLAAEAAARAAVKSVVPFP